MTFSVCNTVFSSKEPFGAFNDVDYATAFLDFLGVAAITTVVCLTVVGKMNLGIPGPVGTLSNPFIQDLIIVGSAVVFIDLIVACVKAKTPLTKMEKENIVRKKIQRSMSSFYSLSGPIASRTPSHRVLESIYLGNGKALLEATNLEVTDGNEGMPVKLNNNNPKGFKIIISICPLHNIKQLFQNDQLTHKKEADYRVALKSEITWHYIGKVSGDAPEAWGSLVYDCTFLKGEYAAVDDLRQYYDLNIKKAKVVEKTDLNEWLEPVFQELDKGFKNQEKVLVHCLRGASRSAAIIAAYLIKRFKVSDQEAIDFLKSKRACVETKFMSFLNAYYQCLKKNETQFEKFKNLLIFNLENEVQQLRGKAFLDQNQIANLEKEINRLKKP